jgi:uncharacterized protein YdaU (DUF1376 family)
MKLRSYPWYLDDWRGSETVAEMNLEEKGMFRELLDRCWELGSLPVDESLLRRFCGGSAWEWKRSWPRVSQQFYEADGRLHNSKVDEKRPDIEHWKAERSESGRKGAWRRWHGSAMAQPLTPECATTSTSTTTTTEPAISPSEEEYKLTNIRAPKGAQESAKFSLPKTKPSGDDRQAEWFDAFWKPYPRKVGKLDAEKAFKKCIRSEEDFQNAMAALQSQMPKLTADLNFCPYPAAWLRKGHWANEPEAPARVGPQQAKSYSELPRLKRS